MSGSEMQLFVMGREVWPGCREGVLHYESEGFTNRDVHLESLGKKEEGRLS